MYPIGHFGFTAVIFLVVFPLMQVIEVFFAGAALATVEGDGVGEGVETACVSFTLTVGDENVNPYAPRCIQPSFSLVTTVATWLVPSVDITLTEALTGALENP